MSPTNENWPDTALLRSKAEADLAHHPVVDEAAPAPADLLHELQVHQLELEMQNTEIRDAHAALCEANSISAPSPIAGLP